MKRKEVNSMNKVQLLERIELGEDSTTQFKENIHNVKSLSEELVAFSNALGGMLIIGVKDDGHIEGLTTEDVRRLNNMVSNAASDNIKPPISPYTKTVKVLDKILLIVEVKPGINKPYCTNEGTYITKSGADKRRVSQEELQRLFQVSQKLHADEMIVYGTQISDVDTRSLNEYFKKEYTQEIETMDISKNKIMENLFLAKNNELTLAGLLLFGKEPHLRKPMFIIKAVSFLGNELSGTVYRDSEDIKGNIPELFKGGISFITRNLRKVQNNKNFNSEGDLEIPKIVLEELLVNAIIHRDYFIDATIYIFIFDNRIEIINPGKLPNSLSVENIRYGISVIRNPVITSFASKLLPYRGLGSGIVRALKYYDKIDFINDPQTERFKVIIHRAV